MLELLLIVAMCGPADRINDHARQIRCREREVSLIGADENLTQMQCMMLAPMVIAQWIDEHPKWVQRRWLCRPAGQVAKI